ncbi:MAG: DUF695 domain-containing protein [Planctomycetota bacterium]
MSEEWEFYFTSVNGQLASILVDVGIRETAPDSNKPWLLRVWTHFHDVEEHGLPSEAESDAFAEVEETLVATLTNSLDAVLAGRITTAGRREFFCYAPSFVGFEEAMSQCLSRFPDYQWALDTELDSDWSQYLNLLYPNPADWQQIQNRQVIEQLVQHGDSLEKERMVFHWAYFPNESSREQFGDEVKRRGFEITDASEEASPDEANSFGIGFERIEKVDWESINQITLELLELAESLAGTYDGWETTVEADAAESDSE